MNLCADLLALVAAKDSNAAGVTWDGLLQLMSTAVQRDVATDFVRPTALALMRLCQSAGTAVEGPNPAAPTTTHFAVSMTL